MIKIVTHNTAHSYVQCCVAYFNHTNSSYSITAVTLNELNICCLIIKSNLKTSSHDLLRLGRMDDPSTGCNGGSTYLISILILGAQGKHHALDQHPVHPMQRCLSRKQRIVFEETYDFHDLMM